MGKTIGELYGPAMEITDPEDAAAYFEQLVLYGMSYGQTRDEAIEIVKSNLGYYAGYYSNDTRLRVEKLFNCEHPVFGAACSGTTATEAFEAGKKLGQGGAE